MLIDSITMQPDGPRLIVTLMGQPPVTLEGDDMLFQQAAMFNTFLGAYPSSDYSVLATVVSQDQYTIEVNTLS
jgi:hypothetical protein